MLNSVVKHAARRLGFDLCRYRPANSSGPQLIAMLSAHSVNFVFDVGANTGQFAQALREDGYRGRIVSFEPLIAAHEKLVVSSKKDPLWEVAPQGAIGSEDGEVDLHVAHNTVSSSVLKMLHAHANIAPEPHYVGTERVSLWRLDSVANNYLQASSVPFL